MRGKIILTIAIASIAIAACATDGGARSGPAAPAQAAPQASPSAAAPTAKASAPPKASIVPPEERPIARLAYAGAEVSLRRGESLLPGSPGAALLPYDLVSVGKVGRAELLLGPGSADEVRLELGPRSSLRFDGFEAAPAGAPPRPALRLLSGSLSLELPRKGSGLGLRSGPSLILAEGASFSIEAADDGSFLLSCAEGQVACGDAGGRSLIARPGTAIEGSADGKLALRPLPPELSAAYRSSWTLSKEGSLSKGGAALALSLSAELAAARPAFESAFAGLEAQAATLDSWERRLATGPAFGPDEGLADRKAVVEALRPCLSALPAFEIAFYRLSDLASRREAGLSLGGSQAQLGKLDSLFAAFAAGRQADEASLGRLRRALHLLSRLDPSSALGPR